MTKLLKPVVRETVQLHRGRSLVVSLEPAGYVQIRPKNRRLEVYRLSFEQIIVESARRTADHERAERALQKRAGRRHG
jgi:hypothetical protein